MRLSFSDYLSYVPEKLPGTSILTYRFFLQTTTATGRRNMSLDPQMLKPPDKPSMKRLDVKAKMIISGS